MSVDQTVRERLKKDYGDELGDQLATLLQECIDEGNTKEKDLTKCFKQKLKDKNLEDKVTNDKKDDMGATARYIVVIS